MKTSDLVLAIAIPCFIFVLGTDLYYGRGMIMSPSIVGDILWFTLVPAGLYLVSRRDEKEEVRP